MILYLQEEDRYSEIDLIDKLKSVKVNDVNGFLKSALSSKVISSEIEKKEYGYSDSDAKIRYYKIKFVGILKFESSFIISYPKYINDIQSDIKNSNSKFKNILKVIEKYYIDQIYENDNESGSELSNLNLQVKIIKDFLESGIYRNEIYTSILNGEEEIVWEDTISSFFPYINNKNPIYLDYFTRSKRDELENIARKIHKAVLVEIQDELGLIANLLGFDKYFIESDSLSNIGDDNYLIRVLENELRLQNVTIKQNLLKDLIKYISSCSNKSYTTQNIEIYGTASFNLVWEQICRKVYKDNLNTRLKDLNLELIGTIKTENSDVFVDYSQRGLLKDIVDKPIWSNLLTNNIVTVNSGALLDVLHVNYQSNSFDIYDGKYYSIRFEEESISGQPGIEDINKQYLYQQAFSKLARINNFRFKNYFVIPVDDLLEDKGDGVEMYKVSIPYISELGLEDIVVIGRDCSKFYNAYLD